MELVIPFTAAWLSLHVIFAWSLCRIAALSDERVESPTIKKDY